MVTGLQLASLGIDPSAYEDLSEEEIKALESILTDISNGNTDQYNELYYTDYKEIPVDYYTFLVDDQFLGKSTKHGTRIYDFWKQEGQKIFNTQDAVEVALSGAIGTGKTTNGCAMMAYHMYSTMCMRDPQDFFGLRTGSKIAYVFLNNTLDSSAGVGYDTFQSFLMHSPWFLKHGNVVGRTDETRHYVPDGGFEILIGSRVQHTLGHNCIACLMDEVSFSTGQDVNYTKSKIMDVYRNIRRRIDSRFTVQGKNYGKLFLVSSKATESSFLEAYIADQVKKGYPIYVVDKPIWEVKPFMYSGETFKAAVGNKYLPSRIIPSELKDEQLEQYCDSLKLQGLRIIDVPVEEKQAFDQDIDKALQDIAGISTAVVTKAFNSQKVLSAISDVLENPFTTEIVTVGLNDDLQLRDFFDVTKIPDNVVGMPVFIHLDASLSGDRTGLAGVAVVGTKTSVKHTPGTDSVADEAIDELVCQEVFHVGIKAPSDSEISFEKTRQFIYYLKDEVGLNIRFCSSDGFQSADFRQILSTKGFEVGYTSLDRTPDGYDGLRSAIYDKRMILLKGGEKLFEELTDLERDNMSRKYDHPLNSSKDIADSLAGAHSDAMKYRDEFMFFHPDDYDYEGINSSVAEDEKIKNDMIKSFTTHLSQKTDRPLRSDFYNSDYEDNSSIIQVPKKLNPEDIFSDIDSSFSKDDGDILFL